MTEPELTTAERDVIDALIARGWRVTPPRLKPKRNPKLIETLSRAELDLLIAEADPRTYPGQRNRALMELLYATGLRIGEALALTHDDIEWHERAIMVTVRDGKSGARRVPAPLYVEGNPTPLKRELCRWLDADAPGALLFPTQTATPTHRNSFARALTLYAEKAGIQKRVHPHMFRHSYASNMLRAGVQQSHLADLLGHHGAHRLSMTDRYISGNTAEDMLNSY